MRTLLPATLCTLLVLTACDDDAPKNTPDSDADADADADTDTDTDTDADTDTSDEGFPDNAWYHADESTLPDDLSGSRWSAGEVVPDLHMVDQNGDAVSLYQFYGRTVALDISAMWCSPCHQLAPYVGAFMDSQDEDDGVIMITVLLESSNYTPGRPRDVADWVDLHGSHGPVVYLKDPEELKLLARFLDAYPSMVMIDAEMQLVTLNLFDEFDTWVRGLESLGLAAGAMLGAEEVCDDGKDNDADFLGDCADERCHTEATCAQSEPISGSLGACGWEQAYDIWQIDVTDQIVEVTVDNASAEGAFETLAYARPAGSTDWDDRVVFADDEIDCAYPTATFGCGRGWLAPGSWDVIVTSGLGNEGDGDCVSPDRADYALSFRGAAEATLTADDVSRPW